MKTLAVVTLALTSTFTALAAGEKPAADVFQQSPFKFTFKAPASFKLTASNTGYIPTPMGDVPYEEKAWQNKADVISTKQTVMPDLWWQTRADNEFTEVKQNMLSKPGVTLISERDYSVGGCRAHSLVLSLKTEFQRIDFFLVKPDLRVVMYLSPKQTALDGALCKKVFESISITPKASAGQGHN